MSDRGRARGVGGPVRGRDVVRLGRAAPRGRRAIRAGARGSRRQPRRTRQPRRGRRPGRDARDQRLAQPVDAVARRLARLEQLARDHAALDRAHRPLVDRRHDALEAVGPGDELRPRLAVEPLDAVPGVDAQEPADRRVAPATPPTSRDARSSSRPPTCDASGRSTSTRTRSAAHHAAASSSPRARSASATTGASRSSSNQARLVGPTGAPVASDPSGASSAHSRSAASCDGSPIVSTTGSDARALAATALDGARDVARGARRVGHGGDEPLDRRALRVVDHRAQRVVDRRQLELAQRALERGHAASAQPLRQPAPDAGRVVQLADLPEHAGLVGAQRDVQAALPDARPPSAGTRARSAARGTRSSGRPPTRRPSPSPSASVRRTTRLDPSPSFTAYGGGLPDPARRLGVPVVVHDERPRRAAAVRVREHVLVDATAVVRRRRTAGSRAPRRSRPRRWSSGTISRSWRATSHSSTVSCDRRAAELHAVLLGEPLELPVPEHRQARAASPASSRRRCTCRPSRTARPRSSRPGCS